MNKAIHLTLTSLVILLAGCAKKMPSASEVANQINEAYNRNAAVPIVAIEHLKVRDLYQDKGFSYILVDFDVKFLISKAELLAARKVNAKSQSGALATLAATAGLMWMDASLADFKTGDVKQVRGESLRVIRSENGWVIDPNQ